MLIKKEELKKQCKEHKIEKIPPLKAIRKKCLDCCCNQRNEVDLCTAYTCPLWPYRTGISPFSERTKTMSEEQRQAASERFKKYHEQNKTNKKKEK